MESYQITLAIVAVVVWGVAVCLHAFFKRGPSDEEITKVVTSVVGSEPREGSSAATPDDAEVAGNLLRFFELSSASRALLRILVSSEERMSFQDLTLALNASLAQRKRTPLPVHAVRAVVMNLMGAYLADLRDGGISATPAGHKVMSLIADQQV